MSPACIHTRGSLGTSARPPETPVLSADRFVPTNGVSGSETVEWRAASGQAKRGEWEGEGRGENYPGASNSCFKARPRQQLRFWLPQGGAVNFPGGGLSPSSTCLTTATGIIFDNLRSCINAGASQSFGGGAWSLASPPLETPLTSPPRPRLSVTLCRFNWQRPVTGPRQCRQDDDRDRDGVVGRMYDSGDVPKRTFPALTTD